MAKNELPTIEYLRQCFDANFETGILIWRERPRDHFNSDRAWKSSNSKFCGLRAGGLKPNGYYNVKISQKWFKVHRVIFAMAKGKWPTHTVDHINGKRSDNRLLKLRDISFQENMKNKAIHGNNTSGMIGVCWHKASNKWQAQIGVHYLGLFDTQELAFVARKSAEKEYGYHENHGRQ